MAGLCSRGCIWYCVKWMSWAVAPVAISRPDRDKKGSSLRMGLAYRVGFGQRWVTFKGITRNSERRLGMRGNSWMGAVAPQRYLTKVIFPCLSTVSPLVSMALKWYTKTAGSSNWPLYCPSQHVLGSVLSNTLLPQRS